jgi:phosphoribosyl-ATP pyrophosphohydrolase
VNQEKLGEERFARLAYAVAAVRAGIRASPRTARLISGRISKMAQKVIEEASEVAIDAVRLQRTAVISESVDLFYNLVVLWDGLGITPTEVWAEMDLREKTLGMAEKLPKEEVNIQSSL